MKLIRFFKSKRSTWIILLKRKPLEPTKFEQVSSKELSQQQQFVQDIRSFLTLHNLQDIESGIGLVVFLGFVFLVSFWLAFQKHLSLTHANPISKKSDLNGIA